MNVLVHSKTVPVTEAMRTFIRKQANKLGKFSQPIQSLQVFLENRKNHDGISLESQVNIQLKIPGKDILTSAKAPNLYAAINEAMEDAVRSLRKRKEKFMVRRQLIAQKKRGYKLRLALD